MTSKVTRVVLHKHGMGCFERLARVSGDAHLDLSFRHDEMDDALKSIAALDHGTGTLAAIAYEPHPLLSERLDDIKIGLPEGGGMLALLSQIKGAEVDVAQGGQVLRGRILGIEQAMEARGEVAVPVDHLGLLVGERILRIRLSDISSVTPVDPSLRRDVAILLARMDGERRTERRKVTLDLRGEGERGVTISYVVPATVWKTSYRVVFAEGGAAGRGGRPRILGFAVVDNDSQDDWEDVSLSLVSGLPISFTHDLYSPRRRARPQVRVETEAPIAPPVLEDVGFQLDASTPAGVHPSEFEDQDDEVTRTGSFSRSMLAGMPPRAGGGVGAPIPLSRPAPSSAPSRARVASVRVETRTQELGDTFRYDVGTPISLRAGRSALVPILSEELEGEVVAVYNERVRVGNPLTSFRLRNTSPLTLEGGPATVYREGEYAGEAMIDTMRPDEERLVPFSVELGCRITTKLDSESETVQSVTVANGALYHSTWSRRTTVYTILNTTKRGIKLFVDHPADRGAEYVDTQKPVERTETFDRFVVELEAARQCEFKVIERREHVGSTWITPDLIDSQMKLVQQIGKKRDLAKALEPLLELGHRIAALERECQKIDGQVAEIGLQQDRIRKNLEPLRDENKKERELRERYVTTLDQDETRLEQLRQRREEIQKQIAEARRQFEQTAHGLAL
jgi:hypothetical protein